MRSRFAFLQIATVVLVIVLFTSLLFPSASGKIIQLYAHFFAREVDMTFPGEPKPIGITDTFTQADDWVFAFIRATFTAGTTFQWSWYEPSGSRYASYSYSNTQEPECAKQVCAFYNGIGFHGYRAERELGTWRIDVYADDALLYSDRFTIKPRMLVRITLDADPRLGKVVADDVPYTGDALPSVFTWDLYSVHRVQVDPIIQLSTGERYVFSEWSDGSRTVSRTIEASDNVTYVARYTAQYLLTVNSSIGNPRGSGWYYQGSTAGFSVTSPQPVEGLLGVLGGEYVFDRWSGDSSATTNNASLVMNGPKMVTAIWRVDNTMPYMVFGAIGALVIIALLVYMRGRKISTLELARSFPQRSGARDKRKPS